MRQTFGFPHVPHLANLSALGTKLLPAYRRNFFSFLRDNAGSELSTTSSTRRFPGSRLMHASPFTAEGLQQIYTNQPRVFIHVHTDIHE